MAKPREVLEDFCAILRQPTTLTTRRNAVRTFHDFLKVLLKGLARPEEERFLGQVDLKKRFDYLAMRFPQIKQFEDLVVECKTQRDRVDHSDNEAPPASLLERWNENAHALLETVERCQKEQFEDAGRLSPQFVLVCEFEEAERLVGFLSDNLRARGLSSNEIDLAVDQFRSLYKPYYDWNDAKIDSATDCELAGAIQAVARLNGLFGATLDKIAEVLNSQFTPQTGTIN
jgi:hypothetical protein